MQWTPEADQTLLLTLIKTHPIKIDHTAVAAEWPSDDVKPTARAVKERIAKIQDMAKSRSGGQPATPKRKRAAKATSSQAGKRSSKKQRGTTDHAEESDGAVTSGSEATPTKETAKDTSTDLEDDASTHV